MDINFAVEETESYTTVNEVAANIMTTDSVDSLDAHAAARSAVTKNSKLNDLVKRPGRWYYLSGMNVVHGDDLHTTKASAAEAYRKYLLGE
jgi:muconolactone delta-isomerase